MALTITGKLVVGPLTETGQRIFGNLTEKGVQVDTKGLSRYVSHGTHVGTVDAATVTMPPGYSAGDLLILQVETANQAITTPDGWTLCPGSPIYVGTAGAANATRLTLFYKFAAATESDVTLNDPGDHTIAVMHCFRDVDATSPFNAYASAYTGATLSLSMPAVTTTVNNCLILNFMTSCAEDADKTAIMYNVANASLTGVTVREDFNDKSGNGGNIGLITGLLATAGSSGNTTATTYENGILTYITLALTPATYTEPETIPEGGSEATITVSAESGGLAIRQGSSEAQITISAEGAGVAIKAGASEAAVVIQAESAGISIKQGGSEATITISAEGAGEVVAASAGSGGSEAIVVISAQGSGLAIKSGGSEASINISAQASGMKVASGGSEACIPVSSDGAGSKLAYNGSDAVIEISTDGLGQAIKSGGSEAVVTISAEGSGYGIGLIKSGGSEASISVSAEADGQKIGQGSSEAVIVILAVGFGLRYAPAIMPIVFDTSASMPVTFDTSAECPVTFDTLATLNATFDTDAEMPVTFDTTATMGVQT